jgi:D-alanyl-D-alanine dipeptidase
MAETPDEAARRTYWSEQMNAADAFMRRIMTFPVEECGEPMEPLPRAAREAGIEVAFSDRPHVENLPRLFFLRQGLVPRFLDAARDMNARGWVLKVEDAFRTRDMQRGLGRRNDVFRTVLRMTQWECGQKRPPSDLLFRRLGALVAIAPKVGTHLSGSAMDISILSRDTGMEIDRGGPYLELSERTPMGSPFVSAQAAENRRAITALMGRHGFISYPWEFWHYNAGDAYAELLNNTGRPARYGAVQLEMASETVTPLEDPTALLNSEQDIQTLMEIAVAELTRHPAHTN